jgi:hypothetical protein
VIIRTIIYVIPFRLFPKEKGLLARTSTNHWNFAQEDLLVPSEGGIPSIIRTEKSVHDSSLSVLDVFKASTVTLL